MDVQQVAPEQYGRIVVTQVVPSPERTALPGVAEFRALLAKHLPGSSPNYVALEGFLNAKVLVEGLRRAGPALTRSGFEKALESIHELDRASGDPSASGPTTTSP